MRPRIFAGSPEAPMTASERGRKSGVRSRLISLTRSTSEPLPGKRCGVVGSFFPPPLLGRSATRQRCRVGGAAAACAMWPIACLPTPRVRRARVLLRSALAPPPFPPPQGRAIAYGGKMYFLLSPRGEEGTHRLGDGKERGSFHRQFPSGDNTKAARPPHPPPPGARGPPPPPWEGGGAARASPSDFLPAPGG